MGLGTPDKSIFSNWICTSCGAKRDLSEEHIIPFGLGGNLILPDASGSNLHILSPYWDSPDLRHVRVCAMRAGKSITVSLADRRRLENRIDDRNVAQKYVWRAEIVLFTADGAGTNEIMRRTCKSKTAFGAGRNASWKKGSRVCSATRLGPRGSSRSMARRPPIQTKSSPLSNEGTKC